MTQPAYRVDGHEVSREAFYRYACDPARSAVVEACAGAGKTWMLVSRILRALLDGARPHEILAITFTRKAAGEMQERLNEWLREFADPLLPMGGKIDALIARGVTRHSAALLAPQLAQLNAKLQGEVRAVQIQTFHAWFAQLLRSSPSELLSEIGLQADVELIERLDDHQAAVWRRFHGAVRRDPASLQDFDELCARRGRARLRAWLESALERRVEIERADRAGVLDASVAAASSVWSELQGDQDPAHVLATDSWRVELRDLAVQLARGGIRANGAAERLTLALEAGSQRDAFDAARNALFTAGGTPRKDLGRLPGLVDMQTRLERTAAQVNQHDARREHLAMVRLARILLAQYAAYKREQGLADMSDLETCASSLLRDNALAGWIQERLDARYRHVLIDEFQDTSPLQWHALRSWLTGYVGAGGGVSGQRPPSVFVVGDPKQSIYRFRRAEPRVFEAVRSFVRDALNGVLLECDHTRRNAPAIVESLNTIFTQASERGEFGAYRRHTTEITSVGHAGILALPTAARQRIGGAPAASGSGAAWRDSLCTPRHSVEEVVREEEARHVGRAVEELIRLHGVRAGEIMVLCRKRQSLRFAAQALREVHVPFVALEDHALLDAPEVRDLVAVLDVLASTSHNLSLAQALRSPLFGASDADLMALARLAGGRTSWWAVLTQEPPESTVLQRASALLQGWQLDATRLPPHDLLDRIVHQGEYRERVAAAVPLDQCATALQAIDALLEQALTLDGARYATPYNFVRALKRRSIRVTTPARDDAVQLLTVHGAKGLEARVVLIMDAQPEAATSRAPGLLVDWPVNSDAPQCCAFLYSEGRCPKSLQITLSAEVAAREREELNGLYVAMTRAKERLVMSATEPGRQTPGVSWWHRIQVHTTPWVFSGTVDSHRTRPPATVRLRGLPTLERARRVPDSEASGPGEEADPTQRLLGRAVHRFLEWATPKRDDVHGLPKLAAAAAREFGAPADEVLTVGRTILSSDECARFFDSRRLRWAGNEVPVNDGDDLLRIDRLVRMEETSGNEWWVLDYKLAHRPDQLPQYRDQLIRYRDAIARLEPHATVRCAFVTARGQVIEMT